MKRGKNSKKKAQFRHAKMRALERYDLDLRDEDINNIVEIIRSHKSKSLAKQSNNISINELTYKECVVKVAYDRQRKSIATFIPADSDYEGELNV